MSGDRPEGTRAADASGRIWAELSSNNERLVPLPVPRSRPAELGHGSDGAAQWQARRGQCDMRQVVSAA
jgi:hypothetical protein